MAIKQFLEYQMKKKIRLIFTHAIANLHSRLKSFCLEKIFFDLFNFLFITKIFKKLIFNKNTVISPQTIEEVVFKMS